MLLLSEAIGGATAASIRQWVRVTGRRIARRDAPWLDCPMGPPGRIGAEFYRHLAECERLQVRPAPDAGLLPDFDALRSDVFDPGRVRPEIRDFYEHTARYRLDAWSEAAVSTRLFLAALTRFVSRQMLRPAAQILRRRRDLASLCINCGDTLAAAVGEESEEDPACGRGDQSDRRQRSGLRGREMEFTEKRGNDHRVKRDVHPVEHPAERAGQKGAALSGRRGLEKTKSA